MRQFVFLLLHEKSVFYFFFFLLPTFLHRQRIHADVVYPLCSIPTGEDRVSLVVCIQPVRLVFGHFIPAGFHGFGDLPGLMQRD
jgi:hypothetical protein